MSTMQARTLSDGIQPVLKDFTREAVKAMPDDINDFAIQYFQSEGSLRTDFEIRKEYQLPHGFLEVLKNFTKELLRSSITVDEIYSFGRDYFSQLSSESGDGLPSAVELTEIILSTFMQADAEGKGYLDYTEFRNLFLSLSDQLQLSERDVEFLMEEADANQDGVIEYKEFIPLCVDLIESMYAKAAANLAESEAQENSRKAAESMLLGDMSQEQLEASLSEMFQQADKDGNGVLDPDEFRSCLRAADLGLTDSDINDVGMNADKNDDGCISYTEFIPTAFQMLVAMLAKQIKTRAESPELAAVMNFLLTNFEAEDSNGSGFLQVDLAKKTIAEAISGLSSVQIYTVMSEAEENSEGTVNYKDFATKAAGVLLTMEDVRTQRVWEEGGDDEGAAEEEDDDDGMPGLPNTSELAEIILSTFQQADTESKGYLEYSEFRNLFLSLSEQLSLTEKDIEFLMDEADCNQDGVIEYNEFIPLCVDLIESMYAKTSAQVAEAEADSAAHDAASEGLLNGMSREELEGTLMEMFKQADKDSNGVLDRKEFRDCMRAADLGLRRKDINAIAAQTDVDDDGNISYEEFIPTAFEVLVEMVAKQIKQSAESPELAAVEQFLMTNFEAEDPNNTGVLQFDEIKAVISEAISGLSRVQIYTVMSEAAEHADGTITYKDFATKAAGVLLLMEDVRAQRVWEAEAEAGEEEEEEE
jgi:Ca2+-binding EF-hand superfamily protein